MNPNEPPRARWTTLIGVKVGVWGLGSEGTASIRELLARAELETIAAIESYTNDYIIAVDDSKTVGQKIEIGNGAKSGTGSVSADRIVLPSRGFEALFDCDYVIKSPGISLYSDRAKELKTRGVTIVSGHQLWLNERTKRLGSKRSKVCVITGSKGKSTTTAAVHNILKAAGFESETSGNIGSPAFGRKKLPLSKATETKDNAEYVCLELSSYQSVHIDTPGDVMAITSLSPDHLIWHGGIRNYYRDKLKPATLPWRHPVLVAGNASQELFDLLKASGAKYLKVSIDSSHERAARRLGLAGRHNVYNLALAHELAQRLTGTAIDLDVLKFTRGQVSLPSRLTWVANIDGVDFYDDCLATNVLPSIAALEAFAQQPTVHIVGGADRGIDYHQLAHSWLETNRPIHIVALDAPDNGPRILEALDSFTAQSFKGCCPDSKSADVGHITSELVDTLEAAVIAGFKWAKTNRGVVVLSPAAPSYSTSTDGVISGRYASYVEKAAAYMAAVSSLTQPN